MDSMAAEKDICGRNCPRDDSRTVTQKDEAVIPRGSDQVAIVAAVSGYCEVSAENDDGAHPCSEEQNQGRDYFCANVR